MQFTPPNYFYRILYCSPYNIINVRLCPSLRIALFLTPIFKIKRFTGFFYLPLISQIAQIFKAAKTWGLFKPFQSYNPKNQG